MNAEECKPRITVRNAAFGSIVGIYWRSSPRLFVAALVIGTVVAAAGPAVAFAAQQAVNTLLAGSSALIPLTIMLSAVLVRFAGGGVQNAIQRTHQELVAHHVSARVMRCYSRSPSLDQMMSREARGHVSVLQNESRLLSLRGGSVASFVMALVSTGVLTVLLSRIDLWLVLLPLTGLLRLVGMFHSGRTYGDALRATGAVGARLGRLIDLARDPRVSLELRSSGASTMIYRSITGLFAEQNGPPWTALVRGRGVELMLRAAYTAGYVAAIVHTGSLVNHSHVDTGALVFLILVAPQVESAAGGIAVSFRQLSESLTIARSVRALSHISFDAPPGVIALVGDNGSGKSTLLRVVAGIHTTFEGSVTVRHRSVGDAQDDTWPTVAGIVRGEAGAGVRHLDHRGGGTGRQSRGALVRPGRSTPPAAGLMCRVPTRTRMGTPTGGVGAGVGQQVGHAQQNSWTRKGLVTQSSPPELRPMMRSSTSVRAVWKTERGARPKASMHCAYLEIRTRLRFRRATRSRTSWTKALSFAEWSTVSRPSHRSRATPGSGAAGHAALVRRVEPRHLEAAGRDVG